VLGKGGVQKEERLLLRHYIRRKKAGLAVARKSKRHMDPVEGPSERKGTQKKKDRRRSRRASMGTDRREMKKKGFQEEGCTGVLPPQAVASAYGGGGVGRSRRLSSGQ